MDRNDNANPAKRCQSIRRFGTAEIDVVRQLAGHTPITDTLVAICDLVEVSIPGSQCLVVRLLPSGCLAVSAACDVSSALRDAVELRMGVELGRNASGVLGTGRFEMPDPTCPALRMVWCLPIFGLDDLPLGGLCVTLDATEPTGDAVETIQHATRLAQLAIEQRQAGEQLALTIATERELIANELHDDPVQSITVLSLMLQRISRDLPPESRSVVDAARRKADEAIDGMRRMLFELHPAVLDEDGLAVAIEVYLEEAVEPFGIAWTLDDELEMQPEASSSRLAFRLVHEALANVVKHAGASHVAVSLKRKNAGLALTVTDDGCGFDPSTITPRRPGHLGLANLRHLVRRSGGDMEATSEPGVGCTVDIWIPLDQATQTNPA